MSYKCIPFSIEKDNINLFNELKKINTQCFLTGTDRSAFDEIANDTKPLMDMPDEQITYALNKANGG